MLFIVLVQVESSIPWLINHFVEMYDHMKKYLKPVAFSTLGVLSAFPEGFIVFDWQSSVGVFRLL